MPPKRARSNQTSQRAKKIPKLDNQEMENNIVTEERSTTKLKELELALDQNICNPRVLHLIREVVESSQLSTNLIVRLLKFSIKVGINEKVVQRILSQQNIDLKSPEGGTILWEAVSAGNAAIAKLLLRAKADVSVCDIKNRTLLHQVLESEEINSESKKKELVKLLLEYGANVNACDSRGYTILHRAIKCKDCSSELIEILLHHGARVTFGGKSHLDDLEAASEYRPELLLKLIKHQVPDVETRNKRAVTAIHHLLFFKNKKQSIIIKKILELGVPVDTPFEQSFDRGSTTLLHQALFLKQKDVIPLLLDYGADPNQKDSAGRTALFRATIFKGFTHASRWLIEKGASVHTRNDRDGSYPIHGACMYNSEKNIHLFLSLGANLYVTDNDGFTPFRWAGDKFKFTDAHRLIIKHFALTIAKGGTVCDSDLESAKQYVWGNHHYEKCTRQLQQMKKEKICDDIYYFSLLSEDTFSMLQLMKNPDLAKNFKRDRNTQATLFPEYFYMLLHCFDVAEKRYNIFLAEKEQIQKVFCEIFPDAVIEKIVYYLCLEKLEQCKRDYYMSFHASLKTGDADREKVLS